MFINIKNQIINLNFVTHITFHDDKQRIFIAFENKPGISIELVNEDYDVIAEDLTRWISQRNFN